LPSDPRTGENFLCGELTQYPAESMEGKVIFFQTTCRRKILSENSLHLQTVAHGTRIGNAVFQ
jgi:hypothetical protein